MYLLYFDSWKKLRNFNSISDIFCPEGVCRIKMRLSPDSGARSFTPKFSFCLKLQINLMYLCSCQKRPKLSLSISGFVKWS